MKADFIGSILVWVNGCSRDEETFGPSFRKHVSSLTFPSLHSMEVEELKNFPVSPAQQGTNQKHLLSSFSNLQALPHFTVPLPCLTQLDLSGCPSAFDDTSLQGIGLNCHVLRKLILKGCQRVTDIGVQNLIFPPAILKRGEINLANPRIRTNPITRHLRVRNKHLA